MVASVAFAFDFAFAQQAVEPGTGPGLFAADQPGNLRYCQPCVPRHLLHNGSFDAAGVDAMRCVDAALGPYHRHMPSEGGTGFTFLPFGYFPVTGTAIFSFSSVQVFRTSAVTNEQFSIWTKMRLASSR
jgi:hypothetical protein